MPQPSPDPNAKPHRPGGREPTLPSGSIVAGKYRVLKLLGKGGFGAVYLVEVLEGIVGDRLALKLLAPHLSGDPRQRERFLAEIRVAMKLVHPAIVPVRDVGLDADGQLYYTMDHVPGPTLAAVLKKEGRLEIPRALAIARGLLSGLAAAHAKGFIHRDLKPANIILAADTSGLDDSQDPSSSVRILDFGIATAVGESEGGKRRFVGSPPYMALEQFLGKPLSFASDLYAVGVVLYECLTGLRPFPGATAKEVFAALRSRPLDPPEFANPALADWRPLGDILEKALERDPRGRYQSAADFLGDLDRVTRRAADEATASAKAAAARWEPVLETRAPRRLVLLATALAGVLAVALVAWRLGRSSAPEPDNPDPQSSVDRESTKPASGADPEAGREVKTPATPAVSEAPPPKPPADPAQQAQTRLSMAEATLTRGDWRRAALLADEALAFDPAIAGAAQRVKGLALFRLGRHGEALASLQEHRRLAAGAAADPEVLWALARSLWREGQAAEALVPLRGYLDRKPSSTEAHVLLVEALEKLEADPTEIREAIRSAFARGAQHPYLDKAKEKWVDTPGQEPETLERLVLEAEELERAGQHQGIVERAGSFFSRLKPPDPRLGQILAGAYFALDKTSECRLVLRKILPADGALPAEPSRRDFELAVLFGRLCLRTFEKAPSRGAGGPLEEAVKSFGRALELCERLPPGALPAEGHKSEAEARRRLKAQILTWRGYAHAQRLDRESLVEDVAQANRLDDQDPELILLQGRSFYLIAQSLEDKSSRERSFERAISRLQRYLQLAPKGQADPEAFFLVGLAYVGLGNRARLQSGVDAFRRAYDGGLRTPKVLEAWGEALATQAGVKGKAQWKLAALKFRESYDADQRPEPCVRAVECYVAAGMVKEACFLIADGVLRWPTHLRLQELRLQHCNK